MAEKGNLTSRPWCSVELLEATPVIVCHCTAVTDRTVTEVIAAGARDEFDVAEACGAGGVCGGCVPTITHLLGDCAGCPIEAGRQALSPLRERV